MVVKINNKSIRVDENNEKAWYREFDWFYVVFHTMVTMFLLYFMDYVAWIFLRTHPFPFMKFVGVILSWFGV